MKATTAKTKARTAIISVRFSEKDLRMLRAAAEAVGLDLSTFLRMAALAAAWKGGMGRG